jgi:hypothetical protein
MPNVFWPYSRRAAVVLAVVTWIALGAALAVSNSYAGWPNDTTAGWLPFVVLALGLAPLVLVMLDSFRSSQAKVDLRWVKFDFSAAGVVHESFGIPDNIVAAGVQVGDSGGPEIEAALEKARQNRILIVDLREGDAWWVTRLLVLAAGAVRSRTTEAIVFLGTREEVDRGLFLGWATPEAVLRAILKDRPDYQDLYEEASTIERQLEVFGKTLRTTSRKPPGLEKEISLFAQRYDDPMQEVILLDLVAGKTPPEWKSYEEPPDRLTEARLEELLAHSLYRNGVVDLEAPNEEQTRTLLAGHAPFVAVVAGGRFKGLLRRTDGERFILRQLFEQGRNGAAETRRPAPTGR